MKDKSKLLLLIDAFVNLIIGCILIFYSVGIEKFLGLPAVNSLFYPIILGGVILGIAVAFFFEWKRSQDIAPGLGITGAVIINLFGSMALISCLVFLPLNIPLRGFVLLWVLAVTVFLIGYYEFRTQILKSK